MTTIDEGKSWIVPIPITNECHFNVKIAQEINCSEECIKTAAKKKQLNSKTKKQWKHRTMTVTNFQHCLNFITQTILLSYKGTEYKSETAFPHTVEEESPQRYFYPVFEIVNEFLKQWRIFICKRRLNDFQFICVVCFTWLANATVCCFDWVRNSTAWPNLCKNDPIFVFWRVEKRRFSQQLSI
jgi:hypothetical protein